MKTHPIAPVTQRFPLFSGQTASVNRYGKKIDPYGLGNQFLGGAGARSELFNDLAAQSAFFQFQRHDPAPVAAGLRYEKIIAARPRRWERRTPNVEIDDKAHTWRTLQRHGASFLAALAHKTSFGNPAANPIHQPSHATFSILEVISAQSLCIASATSEKPDG